MKSFLTWLSEATKTVRDFLPDAGHAGKPLKDRRDAFNFPFLDKPSFRAGDVKQINAEHGKVEQWLNKSTEKFGVNWLLLYLPPEENTQTIDPPEYYNKAVGVKGARKQGEEGWNKYQPYAIGHAKNELDKFLQDYQAQGATIENTIVYVKPTSRVHGLSGWQQAHNVGHGLLGVKDIKEPLSAVAGTAGKNPSAKAAFVRMLRDIVYEMQQKHYDQDGRKPNWVEMVLTLGRVLGVGASFRRLFSVRAGQLDTNFLGNTALNAKFQEALYELMTIYINSGGKFPIQTTGAIKDTPVADRSGELPRGEAGAEIDRKFPNTKARDWVYKPLASSQQDWESAVAQLDEFIGKIFKSCTWGKVGGPIFATHGFVSTGA